MGIELACAVFPWAKFETKQEAYTESLDWTCSSVVEVIKEEDGNFTFRGIPLEGMIANVDKLIVWQGTWPNIIVNEQII
jgi:hypothetical protein